MFKKNRTVWGIAALVASYLSLFISVVFAPENKRVSRSMLLMSITQLLCGLMLVEEECEVRETVRQKSSDVADVLKTKSHAVADHVKSKIRIPVADEDDSLLDETDVEDIEEAINEDLCADEN